MFVCEKNFSCCSHKYWDRWEDVEQDAKECGHLHEVVPVIRCKDCKHYSPYEGEEHKGDCLELVGLESCVYEDDFCSYAEPKARDEE